MSSNKVELWTADDDYSIDFIVFVLGGFFLPVSFWSGDELERERWGQRHATGFNSHNQIRDIAFTPHKATGFIYLSYSYSQRIITFKGMLAGGDISQQHFSLCWCCAFPLKDLEMCFPHFLRPLPENTGRPEKQIKGAVRGDEQEEGFDFFKGYG